jgi:hypothetical protein
MKGAGEDLDEEKSLKIQGYFLPSPLGKGTITAPPWQTPLFYTHLT